MGGLDASPSFGHAKESVVLLAGGFKVDFIFTPIWGRFPNLTIIFFQMGCNHQLACFVTLKMKTYKTMGFKRKKLQDCICTYRYIYPQLAVPLWWILNCTKIVLSRIHTWIVMWDIRIPLPGIDHISPDPQEPGPAAELKKTSTVKRKRQVFEWPFMHGGSWYQCFAINHFVMLQQRYNGFMSYFLQR